MAILDLGPALEAGLRPNAKLQTNSLYMETMKNQIPTEYRSRQPIEPEYPDGLTALSMSWPHPAFHRLAKKTLRTLETTIYDVTEATGAWSEVALNIFKGSQPTAEAAANPGFTGSAASWTVGANWAYGSNAVAHTSGATATVSQACLTIGRLYRVTVVVTACTAGNITPSCGTAAGSAISTTGTHIQYITCAANTTLALTPSSSFVGTVTTFSALWIEPQAITVGGGVWHSAGFGETNWFMTNGATLVWNMPSNVNGVVQGIESSVVFQSLCNHDDRLVLAGPSGTWFSDPNWTALFEHWKMTSDRPGRSRSFVTTENMTIGTDWIIVSERGGGDLTLPYMMTLAMLGIYPDGYDFTTFKEVIYSAIENGTIIIHPVVKSGPIRAVKAIGRDLVVYGERAVVLLTLTENGYVERDEPLVSLGVPARGAAGGDSKINLFVTNTGYGYTWDGSNLRPLDYQEYFGAMTQANLVVSYDPEEKYFWIADGATSYCLTRKGLGESKTIVPSSVFRSPYRTALVGCHVATGEDDVELTWNTVDGGDRRMYQTTFMKLASTDTTPDGWTAYVLHRHDAGASFESTDGTAVDKRGMALVQVPFTEAKPHLTATDYSKVTLDRLDFDMNPLDSGGKTNLKALLG